MKNKFSVLILSLIAVVLAVPFGTVFAQFGNPTSPVATPKTIEEKKTMEGDAMGDAMREETMRGATVGGNANADLNGDGRVEFADLSIMLAAFGKCPAIGDCPEDLNGNMAVDEHDLDLFRGSWQGGPASDIASMVATCRTLEPVQKFGCFAKLAQQLEIQSKERMVFSDIQNRTVSVPNPNVDSAVVERTVRNILIYVNNIVNRGYITLNRLETLADRLESRIVKQEEETGETLTDARNYLSQARTTLTQVRAELGEISGSYEKMFQNNPSVLFDSIRNNVSSIKMARDLLLKTVQSL